MVRVCRGLKLVGIGHKNLNPSGVRGRAGADLEVTLHGWVDVHRASERVVAIVVRTGYALQTVRPDFDDGPIVQQHPPPVRRPGRMLHDDQAIATGHQEDPVSTPRAVRSS